MKGFRTPHGSPLLLFLCDLRNRFSDYFSLYPTHRDWILTRKGLEAVPVDIDRGRSRCLEVPVGGVVSSPPRPTQDDETPCQKGVLGINFDCLSLETCRWSPLSSMWNELSISRVITLEPPSRVSWIPLNVSTKTPFYIRLMVQRFNFNFRTSQSL